MTKPPKEPTVTERVAALENDVKKLRKALRAIASDNYQVSSDWARGIARAAIKASS